MLPNDKQLGKKLKEKMREKMREKNYGGRGKIQEYYIYRFNIKTTTTHNKMFQ